MALLGGTGMLMVGTGLQGTVVGIRANLEGFPTAAIGAIMSGYYLGYLVGSTRVPALLARVGHIRVFAALAATASSAMLAHLLFIHPVPWAVLRFVTGVCIAGLFIAVESWLNGQATQSTRGRLLAFYLVVVMGGLLAGQLLVSVTGGGGYAGMAAASALMSIGIVPVALTRQNGPALLPVTRVRISELVAVAPLAVVGVLLSGAAAGVVFGLSAVFALDVGYSSGQVAVFAGAAAAGALVMQIPVGRLSDRVDRRWVIVGTSVIAVGAALSGTVVPGDRFAGTLVALVLVGGTSIPLYALCVAHTADYLASHDITAAGAKLVLLQGMGAAVGPLAAGLAMAVIGPDGFFWFLAVVHLPIAGYGLWRLSRRGAAPADERSEYLPVSSMSTPAVFDVLDDEPHGVPPVFPGELVVADRTISYRSRGEGPGIVLVHGSGESGEMFERAAVAAARIGWHAVTVDLPGHGNSEGPAPEWLEDYAEVVSAVISHLGMAPAVLVARGAGVAVAVHVALDAAEQVASLVAVDPAWGLGPANRAEQLAGRAGLAGGSAAKRARRAPVPPAAVAFRRAVLNQIVDERLAGLEMPVSVVLAGQDPVRGWAGGHRLVRRAPLSQFHRVDEAHQRVATDSAEFVEVLMALLDEAMARRG